MLANAAAVPALVLSVGLMSRLGARGVFLAAGTLVVVAAALTAGALRNVREIKIKHRVDDLLGHASSASTAIWYNDQPIKPSLLAYDH
jgi:hypothetical protein